MMRIDEHILQLVAIKAHELSKPGQIVTPQEVIRQLLDREFDQTPQS